MANFKRSSIVNKSHYSKSYYTRLSIKLFVHLIFFIHHCVVNCQGLYMYMVFRSHESTFLREFSNYTLAFATNWNFAFQHGFLLLAIMDDIVEWAERQDTKFGTFVRFSKDTVFKGVVVPFSVQVFIGFWVMFTVDREIVFPKVFDQVVPYWYNQSVHTVIMVVLVIEHLMHPHRRPTSRKVEYGLMIFVIVAYAIVYFAIKIFADRWLYQIFEILTWWQICLFLSVEWGVRFIAYEAQFPLNRLVHGSGDPGVAITKETC